MGTHSLVPFVFPSSFGVLQSDMERILHEDSNALFIIDLLAFLSLKRMFPVFPNRMNANSFITILPSSFLWSLHVNPSSKFCSMSKLAFHSVFLVKPTHTTVLNSLFPILFSTIYWFIIEVLTRCDLSFVLLASKDRVANLYGFTCYIKFMT